MTLAMHRPMILTPSADPTPVEHAAASGIADDHDPETFLWIVFRRPDGGARVWYAWTSGGCALGDRVDGVALTAGLDAADWLHIGGRHVTETTRGRIATQAHPLRPILVDVQGGVRAPGSERDKLRQMVALAGAATGRTPAVGVPCWQGVGPALLRRPAA